MTIVNESLARRYFRGLSNTDVVGKRIAFGRPQDNSPWVTIVGVVADEKQDRLDEAARPEAYVPMPQDAQNPMTFARRMKTPTLVVHGLLDYRVPDAQGLAYYNLLKDRFKVQIEVPKPSAVDQPVTTQ